MIAAYDSNDEEGWENFACTLVRGQEDNNKCDVLEGGFWNIFGQQMSSINYLFDKNESFGGVAWLCIDEHLNGNVFE